MANKLSSGYMYGFGADESKKYTDSTVTACSNELATKKQFGKAMTPNDSLRYAAGTASSAQALGDHFSPMQSFSLVPMIASGTKNSDNATKNSAPFFRKPSANIVYPKSFGPKDVDAWKEFVEQTPRCAATEGIRESSYFWKKQEHGSLLDSGGTSSMCLKRLFQEFETLQDSLPCEDPRSSIWLRFDEETPQYMRALLAASFAGDGTSSTPQAGGLFIFDIYVPSSYPAVPPGVILRNSGDRDFMGFGPNLYRDGKVCLSLLGTWSGPGWSPKLSSLYQVLLSIHGLILGVEHPYFLEPGHGGWEGKIKEGAFQKQQTVTKTSCDGAGGGKKQPPDEKEAVKKVDINNIAGVRLQDDEYPLILACIGGDEEQILL